MTAFVLDRNWIATHIPHHGSMCLLDAVIAWDAKSLHCVATSHQDTDNPMRLDGRLGAAAGIEYAAQAMAIHGVLCGDQESAPKKGYITRVQQLTLYSDTLDDCVEPLMIAVRHLMGGEQVVRYEFTVRGGSQVLLDGQATVMLGAG